MLLKFLLRFMLMMSILLPIEASRLNPAHGFAATDGLPLSVRGYGYGPYNFGPSQTVEHFTPRFVSHPSDSHAKGPDGPIWKLNSQSSAWTGKIYPAGPSKSMESAPPVSMPEPSSWLLLLVDLGGMAAFVLIVSRFRKHLA